VSAIAKTQAEHTKALSAVRTRLDAMDDRFDTVDDRLAKIGEKLDLLLNR
jgi:hypothetical protein